MKAFNQVRVYDLYTINLNIIINIYILRIMGGQSSASVFILGVSIVGMLLFASVPVSINKISEDYAQTPSEIVMVPMGDRVWVSLDGSGEVKPPKFTVLSVTDNEIIFDLKFSGFFSKTVSQGTDIYHKIEFQRCGFTDGLGAPQIPFFMRGFAQPQNAIIQMQILNTNYTTLDGYNLYPTQELLYESYDVTFPFAKDTSVYNQNLFLPSQVVQCSHLGNMRTVEIDHLMVFPLQYNPSAQLLRGYSNIRGKIQFTGGSGVYYAPEKRSPYFEPFFKNILINYAVLEGKQPTISSNSKSPDYNYLIICNDSYYHNVLPLAEWREQNGLKTKVVNISSIGGGNPSWTDVQLFVSEEYWNHSISFLLLVGDSDEIPVAYRTVHHYNDPLNATSTYNGTCVGTDYAYLCFYLPINIFDMLPDVHGGRISVNNNNQLITIVDKILYYEQSPLTSPNWFDDVLLAAQDETGAPFVTDSDEIRDYLTTNESMTCTRIYEDHTTHHGTGLDCINVINNGVFLVNHRDHGGSGNHPPGGFSTGWTHPLLTTNNDSLLQNADLLPIFFNINCESGWFDGETDQDQPGGDVFDGVNAESMPEIYLRHENGSVGMVAASRISWRAYNRPFNRGLIDAIWPEFDSQYPTANDTNPWGSNPVPIYHMGAVLNYAKYFLLDQYGPAISGGNIVRKGEQTLDEYHWHGDPAMQIWTDLPEEMTVGLGKWPFYFTDGTDHWFSNHTLIQVNDSSNLPIAQANISILGNHSNLNLLTKPTTPDSNILPYRRHQMDRQCSQSQNTTISPISKK